jgi:hypothetical protein
LLPIHYDSLSQGSQEPVDALPSVSPPTPFCFRRGFYAGDTCDRKRHLSRKGFMLMITTEAGIQHFPLIVIKPPH